MQTNRFYLDTEFIEHPTGTYLLSIGLAHQDGSTYYAESSETDHALADDLEDTFLQDHVFPKLGMWNLKPHVQIASEITFFVNHHNRSDIKPEFWAWYASYDWYLLCRLFGGMLKMPDGWPQYVNDLKPLVKRYGNFEIPKNEAQYEHNALDDARWLRAAHEFTEREIDKRKRFRVKPEAMHRYHRIYLPKLNHAQSPETATHYEELALAMNRSIEETV